MIAASWKHWSHCCQWSLHCVTWCSNNSTNKQISQSASVKSSEASFLMAKIGMSAKQMENWRRTCDTSRLSSGDIRWAWETLDNYKDKITMTLYIINYTLYNIHTYPHAHTYIHTHTHTILVNIHSLDIGIFQINVWLFIAIIEINYYCYQFCFS